MYLRQAIIMALKTGSGFDAPGRDKPMRIQTDPLRFVSWEYRSKYSHGIDSIQVNAMDVIRDDWDLIRE